MKKPLKRLGIFLIFAVPILYFLFTLLFFSPFEEPFGKIEYVIPRKVDFYLCKAGLAEDITDFPMPDVYNALEVNRDWRAFTQTEMYQEMGADLDLDRIVQEVRDQVRELPIDPMLDIVGRELAVIGKFREGGEPPFSYLVFFRGSWKIKLGFELMMWDMARGFAGDPLIQNSNTFSSPEGYTTLLLGDDREFHLRRESDLIVFGDDEELMKEVCSLIDADAASIDLSLGGSNAFQAKIDKEERFDDAYLDFHFNLENFFRLVKFDDDWKANRLDFSVMTAVDVFDPAFFKDMTGTLRMGAYQDLDAKIDFYRDNVNTAKTGFFELESVPIDQKLDFLVSMLPQDAYFAGCARLDLENLLKIMDSNLGVEMKQLITDLIREARRFDTKWNVMEIWNLIEKFGVMFDDMVYLSLRPRDVDKPLTYGVQPLPIISLVLEIRDMAKFTEFEESVVNLQHSSQYEFKMWKYKDMFHNCQIKGITTPDQEIEQIAYTVLDDRYFLLATSAAFLEDMLRAKATHEQSLRNSSRYKSTAEFIKGHGNMACYLDMEGLKWALHDYAQYWAEINSVKDWIEERKKIRKQVIQSEFPRYARDKDLPDNVENKVIKKVDDRIDQLRLTIEEEEIPLLVQQFRKNLAWIDLLESIAFTINVDVNDLDVGLRLTSLFSK